MSANAWGGVLYRSQSKALVPKVAECFDAIDLSPDEPEAYAFSALPKTKVTWVSVEPLDAAAWDELVECGLRLAKSVARATKAPAWFVANNDYAGIDVISVDARGKKRWSASDDGSWKSAIEDRLDAALSKAKNATERRAAKAHAAADLEKRWAKTPLGRLEAEAKLVWKQHVSHFAAEVKRAAWRKSVPARPVAAPSRPAPVVEQPVRCDWPLIAITMTDLDHLDTVAARLSLTREALFAQAFDRALPKLAKLEGDVALPVSSFANPGVRFELDETTVRRANALAAHRGSKREAVLGAAWLLEAEGLAPDLPAPSFASYASFELEAWRKWSSTRDDALAADPLRVDTSVKLLRRALLRLEQRGAAQQRSLAEVIDELSANAAKLPPDLSEFDGPTEDFRLPLLKTTVNRLEAAARKRGLFFGREIVSALSLLS